MWHSRSGAEDLTAQESHLRRHDPLGRPTPCSPEMSRASKRTGSGNDSAEMVIMERCQPSIQRRLPEVQRKEAIRAAFLRPESGKSRTLARRKGRSIK